MIDRPPKIWASPEILILGPTPGRLFDRPAVAPTLDVCGRCGASAFHDVPIHEGRSTRRDCNCGRTMGFPVWYGKAGA